MPGRPQINEDLKELIRLFQSHGVEFLVVGAHALALYSRPRFTEDLDLFVNRTKDNTRRMRDALDEFGIHMSDASAAKFADDERSMIVLGKKPTQLDLLNFLDGLTFDEAWKRRVPGDLDDVKVDYLSLQDYVITKRASGRPRDLYDIESLKEQLGEEFPGG